MGVDEDAKQLDDHREADDVEREMFAGAFLDA